MDVLDDIQKIEERLVRKATEKCIPVGGTFELLPLCNMNCSMCYIRLSRQEQEAIAPLRSAEEWLSIAQQMKEAGTLFVLLTGGEPLMYPEFKKLYLGLKKLGMIITINTNGTLITEEIAQMFGKDKPRRVNITLYGACNKTYRKICGNPQGFDQTIRGIDLLRKYHVDIKLNGTLVPENKDEVVQLFDIAREHDLYLKVDTYLFPTYLCSRKHYDQSARISAREAAHYYLLTKKLSYSEEKFAEYRNYMLGGIHVPEDEDRSLQCRAGKSSFWIRWNGEMTPCVFMNNPSQNVFTDGFDAAWSYIVEQSAKLHLSAACGKCAYHKICQVCGACTYCETGNFEDRPQYMCEYMETIVNELENMT